MWPLSWYRRFVAVGVSWLRVVRFVSCCGVSCAEVWKSVSWFVSAVLGA